MGCLIGLTVCPGCASKTPGQADCDRGRQLLNDDKPAEAVAAFDRTIFINPQHAGFLLPGQCLSAAGPNTNGHGRL